MIRKFIHFFIPERYFKDELEFRKANTLVWTLVVTYLFTMNYVGTSYFIGYRMGMVTEFLGSFVYIAMLFLFRSTGNIKLVSNITIVCATICIAICCWFSGGYHSAVFPWIAFPAIVVMLISDKNSGWFWLIVNVGIVIWISILNMQGYQFPEEYNLEMKPIFEIICYVGLVVILFLISLVFENGKNRALNLLGEEKKKSDNLLLNILPASIADRLKRYEKPIADSYSEASVVFIDIADFTSLSVRHDPKYLVELLNDVFTKIDKICEKYELEKIKTIGDCYMAVSGIPIPRSDSSVRAIQFSIDVMQSLRNYTSLNNENIQFRVGLDCGPVVAGVIGDSKFIYDLWGDAVNTASRMESAGITGAIHCTDNFKTRLMSQSSLSYEFEDRGELNIKGKGYMQTWLIKPID